MAKIDYKSLKLMRLVDKDTFSWGGQEIEVIKYLPVEARYDIVMITLQKAYEDGIYNPIKLEMYFHLNLIYMYTNIDFAEAREEDESKLYDELVSTGFMNEFLRHINSKTYEEMQDEIEEIAKLIMNYNGTIINAINKVIDSIPENMEVMQKMVENFDESKFQAVIDFAKAANGGREIK